MKKTILYLITITLFTTQIFANNPSLENILNPDGTINVESGYEGSLDFSNYDIRLDGKKGLVANAKAMNGGDAGFTWGGFEGEALKGSTIYAMVLDGAGNLYVGGEFNLAGDVEAMNIAMWDGTTWTNLGAGLNYRCNAMVLDDNGDLVVGGNFNQAGNITANRIAKWDGTTWSSPYETGLNGPVKTMVKSENGSIYVGGDFSTAGTTSASNIARWNGFSWLALGAGLNNDVEALAVHPTTGQIYAGGRFTQSGSNPNNLNYIAYLSGQSLWSPIGTGLNDWCHAIAFDLNGTLYAGGRFTMAGSSNANYVGKWNGTTWSALKTGLDHYCYALTTDIEGNLYAGGEFTNAQGNLVNNISKWNGAAWSALGGGLSNDCRVILSDETAGLLYAGGNFTEAEGLGTDRLAIWNNEEWLTFNNGVRSWAILWDVEVDANGHVYVGGEFTSVGGVPANRIAKWDGASWSALGSGLNDYCWNIEFDASGNLYAGGAFTTAGGITVNHIAKWDGTAWSALGTGVSQNSNAMVYSIYVDETDVYVGGNFTTAGGISANHIAKWDGTSWSTLGSGLSSYCSDLEMDANGILYAGGGFSVAGGVTVNKIAKWDGTTWSGIGGGFDAPFSNYCNDIEFDTNGDLYACGGFTIAGGVTVNKVAKWDGITWSALGSGIAGTYTNGVDLEFGEAGDLYIGGQFTSIGGVTSNNVAKWNGTAWCAIGDAGLNGACYALAHTGEGLVAVGKFTRAENELTTAMAHWRYDCKAPENVVVDLGDDPNRVTISWDPIPGVLQYQVRYRRVLTTLWTNVIANDHEKVITGLVQNKVYDYRVRSKCPDGTWSDMTTIAKFRTVKCQHPENLISTQLTNNRVRVEWDPYTYADKYQIWYRLAGSSDAWTSLVTYQLGMVSRVINNLTDGATYEWKVRSYCELSYGPWSALHYFTNMTLRESKSEFSIASMSPNPASTVLNLTLSSEEKGDVMMTVSDAMGRRVIEKNILLEKGLNTTQVGLEKLQNGYYYISMNNGKEIITEKFLKLD